MRKGYFTMLVSQLHEINQIDNTIEELHAQLHGLYEERAALIAGKNSSTSSKKQSGDQAINLDEIDLSLDDA